MPPLLAAGPWTLDFSLRDCEEEISFVQAARSLVLCSRSPSRRMQFLSSLLRLVTGRVQSAGLAGGQQRHAGLPVPPGGRASRTTGSP